MEAALRGLYAGYSRALLNAGQAALRDADLARDVLQDTLINAWQRCASFRGESELFPWLHSIYRRKTVDMLRRRAPEVPLSTDDDTGAWNVDIEAALRRWRGRVDPTPDEALHSRQSQACFCACAARFAKDHPLAAAVIHWTAEDGLGTDELAALLERSPGATREYMSQCRKKARIYFADWYALTLSGGADGGGQTG